ncbi:ABC transporter ATP-binding protein [Rossellomorea marisflavi]|uniref:ABC transporter ATP-binding protein n=1 Tax=Rossellomorea marisflavi TaxID=189381 RepID=UPI00069FE921|nr:ABC transporter ATP-binding protein [Rossellomorea marisflavi]QHA34640.1 ATP-binding cassette domain-containing protein [Rossellomorea marisflavi]TYO70859.1 ABC transporter ATP-binding protein [Rossellomorea marisflavi]
MELKELHKKYKKRSILSGVSLRMEEGEIVSLVGLSGSGKSTLLRIISGLESPDAGSIHLAGKDVTSMKPKDRPVGMVFQKPLLFPHMTVLENVLYGLKMKGYRKSEAKKEADGFIEMAGLSEVLDHYPSELSGGQMQRVSLIRSLILRPKLLLLDEPFASLDHTRRMEIRAWVKDVIKEVGTTALFVTHDRDEASEMGDRIAVLESGRISQIGTPEHVYHHPATPFIAGLMSDGIHLGNERFVHREHLSTERHHPDDLQWVGLIREKKYRMGHHMYSIHIEELQQSVVLEVADGDQGGPVTITASEKNIQTFD